MKKKYRLLKKADFQEVLNKGYKIFTPNLVCFFRSRPPQLNAKIGIIIPKKKCKLACNRKYLKRVFWSLNTKAKLSSFPEVRCVFLYRESFYEKFNSNNLCFADLDKEYSRLVLQLSKRIK